MFNPLPPSNGRPALSSHNSSLQHASPLASPSDGAAELRGAYFPGQPKKAPLSTSQYQDNALSALTAALRKMFAGPDYTIKERLTRDSLNGGSLCSFRALVSVVEQATVLGFRLPWKRNVGILSVSYGTSNSGRCGLQVGWLHFEISRNELYSRIPELADAIHKEIANSEVGGFVPSEGWDCRKSKKVRLRSWRS